jgi:hypothetical protein
MDLLTTILTCSLYASDDALVRAIAEGPSRTNPYLVLDPAADPDEAEPDSGAQATARARSLLARGGRPVLGLLEVSPAWLDVFGRPLESAFEPCTNIAIGTAMLSEFDYECAAHAPKGQSALLERVNRRACVLRKYETATGSVDFEEAVLLELSAQAAAGAAVEDAPIFAPSAEGPWGPDQLLVQLTRSAAPAASASPRLP